MQQENSSPAARVGNAPERNLPEPEHGLAPVPSAGPERGIATTQKKTLAILDGTRATRLSNGKVLLEISAAAAGVSGDAEIIVNGDVVERVATDSEDGILSTAAFLPESAVGQNLYVAVRIANVMSRVRQVVATPENVDSPELALRLVRQNPSCLADRKICQLLLKSGKLAEHLRERPADYAAITDQAAKGDPDILAATLEADPFMGAMMSSILLQAHAIRLIPLILQNREAALATLLNASKGWNTLLKNTAEQLQKGADISERDCMHFIGLTEMPIAFLAIVVTLFPKPILWKKYFRKDRFNDEFVALIRTCMKGGCETLLFELGCDADIRGILVEKGLMTENADHLRKLSVPELKLLIESDTAPKNMIESLGADRAYELLKICDLRDKTIATLQKIEKGGIFASESKKIDLITSLPPARMVDVIRHYNPHGFWSMNVFVKTAKHVRNHPAASTELTKLMKQMIDKVRGHFCYGGSIDEFCDNPIVYDWIKKNR